MPVAAGPALEGVITRLADQLAAIHAGRYPAPLPDLPAWLAEAAGSPAAAEPAPSPAAPAEAAREAPTQPAAPPPSAPGPEPIDELDQELLPIFLAEAEELLPRLGHSLRQWRDMPGSVEPRQGLQRALHTLKGSARMAGAMRLGDMAHHLETRIIEQGMAEIDEPFLDGLQVELDRIAEVIDRLRSPVPVASAETAAEPVRPAPAIGLRVKCYNKEKE